MRNALRSPRLGILGQGLRFALAGATVAGVYIATTSGLRVALGTPFQLALAIGFSLSICVHFTLQRYFVWASEGQFALRAHVQIGRYLLVAAIQYGLTAAATGILPGVLEVDVLPVYLATTIAITLSNFLIFRTRIFH